MMAPVCRGVRQDIGKRDVSVVATRTRDGCLHIGDELVSLGVDIRRSVVRGTSIRVTDADDVLCGGANP
jgi:hypothetical protein